MTLVLRMLEVLAALSAAFYIVVQLVAVWRSWRSRKGLVLLVLAALPCMASLAEAAGNEARCTELGANCVCSEPLQATSYPDYGTGSHWNPNDTTTKECDVEGTPGAAIARNGWDLSASTDATALSRLPGGHSVSRFLKGPEGHTGIFFVGHGMASDTQYVKRIALRYYIYHSDAYNFSDEVDPNLGCNSKFLQFNAGLLGDKTHGEVHMYNFLTWVTGAEDCCFTGPGPAGNNVTRSSWPGKWWRVEAIMVNRDAFTSGLHWRLYVYIKNVTDGGTERLLIDTDEPGTELGLVNPRIPDAIMNKLLVNNYRGENFANQCVGWSGITHYMVAGWDTDAGQRIGAASEIEGAVGVVGVMSSGSMVVFYEAAPVVTGMLWHFRQAVLSGLLAIWMMGGAFLSLTTQKTKQISYTAATATMQGVNKVLEHVTRTHDA